MTTAMNTITPAFSLKTSVSEAEWWRVHALLCRALFDGDPAYDEDHPDNRNTGCRLCLWKVSSWASSGLRPAIPSGR